MENGISYILMKQEGVQQFPSLRFVST